MPPGGAEGATIRERRAEGGAPWGADGARLAARGVGGGICGSHQGGGRGEPWRAREGGGIRGRPPWGQTGARLAARGWAGDKIMQSYII